MSDDTITVTGNIATDPESRGRGDTPITSFRLATTQRRFDTESGRWVDAHTNWYTVSAFRQLGQHALQSLQKGQRVIVTGRLRVRTWENSSGKGTAVDIDAEAIGHDLRWGTSDFRKDDGGTGVRAVTDWPVQSTTVPAEDWSPPLSTPEATEAPVPPPVPAVAPTPQRELAYAGEETPF